MDGGCGFGLFGRPRFHLNLNYRPGGFAPKAERIHRVDAHTDAAADTGGIFTVQRFLVERKAHDVDAHLAIA